ncbi:MAG: tetratricopeptide repeat protein [Xenococcus sp. (in: cyanobacteria)]
MSQDNKQTEFQDYYDTGKIALERGNYRVSVENLVKAIELIDSGSLLGGEAQIWLVTAYQAAGELENAIALCEKLTVHPHFKVREQASDVLYIMKAPRLERPPEWMVEIPDLVTTETSTPQHLPTKPTKSNKIKRDRVVAEVDLSQVDTKDNQFIGIALIVIILSLSSLFFLQ